ncbi:MAG: sulfatase-like hydrolase/transferase [Microthrixaceae bacterium]
MSERHQPSRTASDEPRRPNVLLVTFDQWRADHLGALGCPHPITPNVDRVAAEGRAFACHHSATAPCGPSRTSMLTGRYQMGHRAINNGTPLDASLPTLPGLMIEAGYSPVLFGYTDTTLDPRLLPAGDPRLTSWEEPMPGFRAGAATGHDEGVLVNTAAATWLEWLADRGRHFYDVWDAYGMGDRSDPDSALATAPAPYPAELSPAAHLTEAAIDYVRGRREPWFVHLTYLQPHPPFTVPEEWFGYVSPDDVGRPNRRSDPAEEAALHPLLGAFLSIPELTEPGGWGNAAWRATYASMVAEVDHQFGRLLGALSEDGQHDDTLVIVTSDHGEQLGDHWLRHKLGWFPESYHVPLVMRWPAAQRRAATESPLPAGQADAATVPVQQFTEHVDLLPTVMEAVASGPHEAPDGRSLLGFLLGSPPDHWRDAAHWEWDFRDPVNRLPETALGLGLDACSLVARRDEHWLTVTFSGAPIMPPLAFDLDADPTCHTDRADDPAAAPALLAATRETLSWRLRHTGGPLVNELAR